MRSPELRCPACKGFQFPVGKHGSALLCARCAAQRVVRPPMEPPPWERAGEWVTEAWRLTKYRLERIPLAGSDPELSIEHEGVTLTRWSIESESTQQPVAWLYSADSPTPGIRRCVVIDAAARCRERAESDLAAASVLARSPLGSEISLWATHNGGDCHSYLLMMEGASDWGGNFSLNLKRGARLSGCVFDAETRRRLFAKPPAHLAPLFEDIQKVPISPRPHELICDMGLELTEPEGKSCGLRVDFEIDALRWNRPWSIGEFMDALEASVRRSGKTEWKVVCERADYLGLAVVADFLTEPDVPVESPLSEWLKAVSAIAHEAESDLASMGQADRLVTLFRFPPNLSTACGQYLLYFAQFLRDLGVEATTDIRHEGAHTLFTVRPESGPEALRQIRDALDVYLNLPDAPDITASMPGGGGVAVAQLVANVHHLRGQLAIAAAVIQAKDATIEAKDATIQSLALSNYQSRQLLGTGTAHDLEQGATPSEEPESESLFGGVVIAKTLEGKGFALHFSELARRLKRRLGKD